MNQTTRRSVLAGTAGVSAAVLGACAGGGPDPAAPPPAESATADPAAPAAPDVLAKTSDIPVNGGTIFADRGVVVTQPTSGEFKAFSSACTHKGCALASVENGAINCRCHGAKFALADGSVQGGPATRPLDAKAIKVDKGHISLA